MSYEYKTKDQVSLMFLRPALVGVSAGVSTSWFLGYNNFNIDLLGSTMKKPFWLVTGLVAAGSSWVAEIGHDFIIPHISKDRRLGNMESMLLAPGITGVGLFLGMQLLNRNTGSQIGMLPWILFGGVSQIFGDYLSETFIEPWLQRDPDYV